MKGEVVGINSQIYSRSGGYQGVSFAIPIDVAMEVADQLKHGGKVSRGWLGVVIQEVTADLAESFGLDRPRGALIAQVQADGPQPVLVCRPPTSSSHSRASWWKTRAICRAWSAWPSRGRNFAAGVASRQGADVLVELGELPGEEALADKSGKTYSRAGWP